MVNSERKGESALIAGGTPELCLLGPLALDALSERAWRALCTQERSAAFGIAGVLARALQGRAQLRVHRVPRGRGAPLAQGCIQLVEAGQRAPMHAVGAVELA